MSTPRRHVLQQGPVVRALLATGLAGFRKRPPAPGTLPGPLAHAKVAPRPADLVRDYVRHCGGDPGWYRGAVPGHLFPQWGFPLLAETLRAIPYELTRVLNGGCRIELGPPLPGDEPLLLEACLEDIDDDGRRAVIRNRLTTSTASTPAAVRAWMYAVVPLGKRGGGARRERPSIPADAVEVARFRLTPRHAVDFAVLTGDFNPIHWLRPWARMAGFPSTILHGFAALAYAIEGLNRVRLSGDPHRLAAIDVKFVRPLVLPAQTGLYLRGQQLFVGAAPGGPATLVGTFEERTDG